jgi:hypothetical protein
MATFPQWWTWDVVAGSPAPATRTLWKRWRLADFCSGHYRRAGRPTLSSKK